MTLDMSSVERIDAAGIAALISLYAGARDAGHCFTVVNPSPRVAEILALVGLERILVSQNMVVRSHSGQPSIVPPHEYAAICFPNWVAAQPLVSMRDYSALMGRSKVQ